ncbi:hypothetical protein [Emticicia sp. 21SJ11W-3]|uniref:hypothetical protein n=1 Tax=Emticicia sp. 21SJ11W-3 TaxID=2916755 RepID=UPI00209DFD6F|nr:hypothetical protein [Emticicia sp. 21SJ11W-3]UTA67900.1 hypothetical protein MB380_20230 [Emticicia sp. 21SJ11W-3]
MKKMIISIGASLLSREQMKKVKGGLAGEACGAAACLGSNKDCEPSGCTTCSTSDGKTPGSCS